jgi:FHS family glucose/mannose:H+ symporter-like MFS transporter
LVKTIRLATRRGRLTNRSLNREENIGASDLPLYVGFAVTGFCCALPGALLPALLSKWGLDDRHGGTLFLLLWLGSSLGALCVRRALRSSIATGCTFLVFATMGLALTSHSFVYPLMMLYGLGLGLTMTSISLLRQQKRATQRSVELVRLNLMWAVGAFACPSLMTHALRVGDPRTVLLLAALFFAALCIWTLLRESRAHQLVEGGNLNWSSWKLLSGVPAPLILMTLLVTGIEASCGAWLATYAQRNDHQLVLTIAAPTCLWAGLLVSRFLGSFRVVEELLGRSFRLLLMIVAASTVSLLFHSSGFSLLVSSFLIGFGLGPIYPLLLARVLSFQEGSIIFFLAGTSSAILPWMTGTFSSHFSSLRIGLIVPASAAVVLLLSSFLPLRNVVKSQ